VGDLPRPKLIFFFDEAHLLFVDAPQALVEKVEQVVRLIRSKGVGVYFVTQNPADIPQAVAAQLGNRVQHALRAFTPNDQKAVRAAAGSFRASPGLDVGTAITELRTGEALVSLLQQDGAPSPVARTLVRPPSSRLGPLSPKERAIIQTISPVGDKYDSEIDRESAEEMLKARAEAAAGEAARKKAADEAEKARKLAERERRANPPLHEELGRQFGRAVQRQVVNRAASSLVRGILGGLFRGRR
jgi:hypothetical protein